MFTFKKMTPAPSMTEWITQPFPRMIETFQKLTFESSDVKENLDDSQVARPSSTLAAAVNMQAMFMVIYFIAWLYVFWYITSYVVSTMNLSVWVVMAIYYVLFNFPLGALLAYLLVYFYSQQGQSHLFIPQQYSMYR